MSKEGDSMSIPEETVEVDCLHECEEKEVVDEDEEGCEADINQKRDIAGVPRKEKGKGKGKVHQFYFVRFWPYNDPEENSKREWVNKQVEEMDQEKKLVVDDKIQEIMSRRQDIIPQLERKRWNRAVLGCGVEWKTMVVNFLQSALEEFNNVSSKQCDGIHVHSPRNWVTHGSHNLGNKEKVLTNIPSCQQTIDMISNYLRSEINRAYFWYSQSNNRHKFEQILEDVKKIQDRHEKSMADAAAKGNLWNPLSSKKAIEEQIKVLNKIPEELRPERDEVMAEIKRLEDEVKALEKDENVVYEKFQVLINSKKEACDFLLNMQNEKHEANANYEEYVSLISKAEGLGRIKDVAALEELSHMQVEKWMGRWNNSQGMRMSYEKSMLSSLDYRQLSRDGRIMNNDEEPIMKEGDNIIKKSHLQLLFSSLAFFMVLEAQSKMMQHQL